MRLPPASANKTIFVSAEVVPDAVLVAAVLGEEMKKSRYARFCEKCGCEVRPLFSKRMSNPWSWLCLVGGLLTCLFPMAIVG